MLECFMVDCDELEFVTVSFPWDCARGQRFNLMMCHSPRLVLMLLSGGSEVWNKNCE